MNQKLTDELMVLNENIEEAKAERLRWFFANKDEISEFKVGDKIYAEIASNNYKLQYAGIVTRTYVKHGNDMPSVCCQFQPDPSYHYGSDTESKGFSLFYNHDHWVRVKQREIERLQNSIK